jgi:hypothetical protein
VPVGLAIIPEAVRLRLLNLATLLKLENSLHSVVATVVMPQGVVQFPEVPVAVVVWQVMVKPYCLEYKVSMVL